MKLPKIATDDAVLFGSLGLAAIGAALIAASRTADAVLSVGIALLVFGVPAVVITFIAAGESK